MRTLIIGDLHHNIRVVDAILATEPHDQVVFLGDYFDSLGDTPADSFMTATWVKGRLLEPRCTLLFGNHDLPYAFRTLADGFLRCSGFEDAKAEAISSVLDAKDWQQMRAVAEVGPWLVSHAGFHRDLLPPAIVRDRKALRVRCQEALQALACNRADPLFAAGRERGGRAAVGGITWCDWKRFEGMAGVHQIVGHTPSKEEPLRHWSPPGNTNFCIDHLNGRTFAVVTVEHTVFKLWRGDDSDPDLLLSVGHDALERSRESSSL